jgi:hypothetical protein
LAIAIENSMPVPAKFTLQGQILTSSAPELIRIANSPPTDIEFLKKVARNINTDLRTEYATEMDKGLLQVHVVTTTTVDENVVRYVKVFTPEK